LYAAKNEKQYVFTPSANHVEKGIAFARKWVRQNTKHAAELERG
jgi:hypothetical protein